MRDNSDKGDRMSRLRRIIFTGLTVLSLLLCVATVVLWVRSYWRYERISLITDDSATFRSVAVLKGRIECDVEHVDFPKHLWQHAPPLRYVTDAAFDTSRLSHTFIGFGWGRQPTPPPFIGVAAQFSIPDAYLTAIFAALPAIRIYRHFRRRYRVLPGHCLKCSYDLRGTPERCPECGTAVPIKASA
jgi:hypothetical protein